MLATCFLIIFIREFKPEFLPILFRERFGVIGAADRQDLCLQKRDQYIPSRRAILIAWVQNVRVGSIASV